MIFAAVPVLIAGLIATGGADQAGRRAVRRRAGRLGHLQRAVHLLSVATTRALALGLFYPALGGALANFVGGARILSACHYALALANEVARDRALNPGVNLATAVAMGSIVTVLALAVAIRKLASFSLRGDAA